MQFINPEREDEHEVVVATTNTAAELLPIYKYKKQLLFSIQNNQITIITGETGTGKTTQIPQYLVPLYTSSTKRIACTQV